MELTINQRLEIYTTIRGYLLEHLALFEHKKIAMQFICPNLRYAYYEQTGIYVNLIVILNYFPEVKELKPEGISEIDPWWKPSDILSRIECMDKAILSASEKIKNQTV